MKQEKRRYPRANIQWHVKVHSPEGSVEGVTKNVSPLGAFIRCARPLKLNEICEVTIDTPDRALQAKAEVVWSNMYGPDDDITPRGMGVRYLKMSSKDRQLIAEAAMDRDEIKEIAHEYMQTLETEVEKIK
jgi:hypothetical protein